MLTTLHFLPKVRFLKSSPLLVPRLSVSRAHLWHLQASASTSTRPSSVQSSSVPTADPSSSVLPPSVDPSPSSSAPFCSLLPSPLDPNFASCFSLILDWIDLLMERLETVIKIVVHHQQQLQRNAVTI